MRQLDTLLKPRSPNLFVRDLSWAVIRAFKWSPTDEGSEFWESLGIALKWAENEDEKRTKKAKY